MKKRERGLAWVLGMICALSLWSFPACTETNGSLGSEGDGIVESDTAGTEGDGGRTEPPGDTLADKKRMVLKSLEERFIQPSIRHFVEACGALLAACQAVSSSVSDEGIDAARDAWQATMTQWQMLELVQLGPAGAASSVIGGMDLRDEIYSWPFKNACRVDQETVEKAYDDVDAFREELINVRGLDALELLLFVEGFDNHCAQNSKLNTSGSWAALSDEEITAQRMAYAETLATILLDHAKALENAWTDGFAEALATAGAGSEVFPTAQDGLNSVSDALFYLDKVTKDMKVAEPAGISECDEDSCPETLESLYAHVSRENVLSNLKGFHAVMVGGLPEFEERYGFVDLLHAVDAGDLAEEMLARTDEAIELVEAVEVSFLEQLTADVEVVRAIHVALKEITTLLKTEFLSTFDLEIPQRAASDND